MAFLREEHGQDLAEYTLILALIVLVSVLLFEGTGASTNTIWKGARRTLSNAASSLAPASSHGD